MSPAHRFSGVSTGARIVHTSTETTGTCVNWLGGQFQHLYLREPVIFEDTLTLARLAGWVVIWERAIAAGES